MRKLVLVLVAIATFSCSKDDSDNIAELTDEYCDTVTDKFLDNLGRPTIEVSTWENIAVTQEEYDSLELGDSYCRLVNP